MSACLSNFRSASEIAMVLARLLVDEGVGVGES